VPCAEGESGDAEDDGKKRMRTGAESPGLKEGEGRGEEHDESANGVDGSSLLFPAILRRRCGARIEMPATAIF
jgi:hypothetical protein